MGICLLVAYRIAPDSLGGIKLLRRSVHHFEKPHLSVLDRLLTRQPAAGARTSARRS